MGYEMAAGIRADLLRIEQEAASLAAPVLAPAAPHDAAPAGGTDFAAALWDAVRGVDALDRAAGERMAEVDSGRSDDLVGAMLASQEASLSFSMLMQVRNKVVGAVDELIKLQL